MARLSTMLPATNVCKSGKIDREAGETKRKRKAYAAKEHFLQAQHKEIGYKVCIEAIRKDERKTSERIS
ncbi:hypothetical protein BO85DRAFT_407704 [Aspergillus piperis CBS 112811]|uniref:Uncharacterized protein n=2 Tax=Aspergillus subgen. Circumdati TaxID=2720871 RepID=A0A8G1QS57_9EURO|nr:hypothetical protein BO85DRAFT_407704 [Aspergillus piperis CBS 112811]OJZ83349.1 hypothetical protein ASPFODRAFT_195038 [Aspergillus luchuensis CBS 106.47]RAH52592.1 hypothetical protein BO85DRAFT_407704 [Aspergillus piperis CBS 112811]